MNLCDHRTQRVVGGVQPSFGVAEVAADLIFQLKRARRQGATDALGRTAVSCMLRLRFPPEGMKSNQVIIEKFVHENWILP